VTPMQDHSPSSPLEFGQRVRELRSVRALTLRALAARLEVSPATLSAIENGKTGVSAQRVARLAEELGVPVQRMFGQAGTETPSTRDAPTSDSPARAGTQPSPTDWRSFRPLQMDQALRGALSAFLEYGYHGAPMRTIAERAGISVAGLYHYYPSKHDMLVALLDLTMTDLLERSTAAQNEGRNPVERFCLLVECLALYHTHRRELGFVGASEMRSLSADARQRVAASRRDMQHMVDEEVEQAVRHGDFRTPRPKEAARAVVTLCTALPQWFRVPGPSTAEQVAAQYVEFALDIVRCVDEPDADTHVQNRVDR
jgi:AcrR family transcriptional regulator